MFGTTFLTWVLIAWGSVTAIFIVLMIFKSLAGLREENVVILDPAESRQAAEQRMITAKVERLTLWAKRFGYASIALLAVSGAIWVYRGVIAFNGGQTP
jgi:hypothetical protein